MIDKKRILQSLLVFFCFGMMVFLIDFTSRSLNYDTIWCFHISQKVANGFDLYSEIGTVVTPIYFWIGSLFIKLFGNSIVSMDIYSGVVSGIIATIIFNIIKETTTEKNVYAVPLFIFFETIALTILSITNYNTCAIAWVLLAAFLEIRKERKKELKVETFTNKKENLYNLFIGIILGLAFFTKQNIGTYGVFATGIFSLVYKCFIKRENTFKEILLKASGFLTVLFSFVIYFFINGNFADFFNFCFGGLLEFGNENLLFGLPKSYLYVITILTICFAMIGRKDEDNMVWVAEIIYLLCMMLLIYPIANMYHAYAGILMIAPVYMILLERLTKNEPLYIILVELFVFFVIFSSMSSGGGRTETEVIFGGGQVILQPVLTIFRFLFTLALVCDILLKNKTILRNTIISFAVVFCFCAGVQTKVNLSEYAYLPEGLDIYKNHGYEVKTLNYMKNVIDYILEKEAEGETVYVVSADASYYMAALGRNQYKYDLNLYGSLGYKGEEKLIEETKQLGDVIILKDKIVSLQEPKKFDEFIKENYEAFDEVGNLIVYRTRD